MAAGEFAAAALLEIALESGGGFRAPSCVLGGVGNIAALLDPGAAVLNELDSWCRNAQLVFARASSLKRHKNDAPRFPGARVNSD